MVLNLYLDANVWLSFYRFSKDDLEVLRKVSVLAGSEITLLLPEQTEVEFMRNRDAVVAETVRTLADSKVPDGFSQLVQERPGFGALRAHAEAFRKTRDELVEDIRSAFEKWELKADTVIVELFGKAKRIPTSPGAIERARLRVELGNPPGKRGSLGDALNWELLLDAVDPGDALHIVTDDADFRSTTKRDSVSPFLETEWRERAGGEVHLYLRLSAFFQEHFPGVQFAAELQKEIVISKLEQSYAFTETRQQLQALGPPADLTDAQARRLGRAICSNSQIYWMGADLDVTAMIRALLDSHSGVFDEESEDLLRQIAAGAFRPPHYIEAPSQSPG